MHQSVYSEEFKSANVVVSSDYYFSRNFLFSIEHLEKDDFFPSFLRVRHQWQHGPSRATVCSSPTRLETGPPPLTGSHVCW